MGNGREIYDPTTPSLTTEALVAYPNRETATLPTCRDLYLSVQSRRPLRNQWAVRFDFTFMGIQTRPPR
jgi:hypothetical protein